VPSLGDVATETQRGGDGTDSRPQAKKKSVYGVPILGDVATETEPGVATAGKRETKG
jgi:hypothetical protein